MTEEQQTPLSLYNDIQKLSEQSAHTAQTVTPAEGTVTVQASQTSTPEDATPPITGNRPTYLLVDGENIDATLGMSVLGRRPNSEERPRWDRIRTFAQNVWGQPVIPLFFLNATSGHLPMGFVSALLAMGYKPIPLSGSGRSDEKVVDIGIQRTLNAIVQREGDVILASHDGDFIPQMEGLLTAEDRRVGVLVFREFLNARVAEIGDGRIEVFDLEQDAGAFTTMLPRVRIIPLDEFDPARYL